MYKIRVIKCNYYHLKIQLAVSSTPTALDGGFSKINDYIGLSPWWIPQ